MIRLPIDPITDPTAWDIVIIAGEDYPYCKVSGFERAYNWDEQMARGSLGAFARFIGQPLASGNIEFLAWEPEHFKAFDAILQLMKYDIKKPAMSKKAVGIWHPSLAEVEIHSIVCKKIAPWSETGNGLYSRTLECLEFRPPPKINYISTPATTETTGSPFGTPNTELAQANIEFDKSMAEVSKLPAP